MTEVNEALIEVIKALGGSKQVAPQLWPVAPQLWPEKSPDAAQRLLLDCLNEDRPARLSPEHLMLILRLARRRGVHHGINAICASLGYGEPPPIEPKDEADELRRQLLEMGRTMQAALARLDQIGGAST